ncbi:hypothetical protein Taro_046664 [Colocasia esculenta]|uniref:GBF-interacting protein 1 N-terminal domain-containing protein n=1 Tax=Colocasia esculenta TaxID=4460 RepID=A0A843WZL0_COLES|nr:hypothetical protein [Colocasia esculenta]
MPSFLGRRNLKSGTAKTYCRGFSYIQAKPNEKPVEHFPPSTSPFSFEQESDSVLRLCRGRRSPNLRGPSSCGQTGGGSSSRLTLKKKETEEDRKAKEKKKVGKKYLGEEDSVCLQLCSCGRVAAAVLLLPYCCASAVLVCCRRAAPVASFLRRRCAACCRVAAAPSRRKKEEKKPVLLQNIIIILFFDSASQPNMEWRPKSSQKSKVSSSDTETGPATPHADNSKSSKVEVAALSDKLSEVKVFDNKHVIIPQHLRVPEAERAGLTFGSFGSGFDSAKGFTSAFQTYANVEAPTSEPSVRFTPAVLPVGTSEDLSLGDQGDLADGQDRTSQSGSPGSAAQSEQLHPENNDSSSPHDTENFADIGLVQSHIPSYDPSDQQQMQNPASLPTFSEAYDPQPSYDIPFFRSAMEDNVHGQRLASPTEALGSHVANSSQASTMAMVQQQTLTQQQPVLYPQVHISHFPNFVPYRQFLSPLYVPPMAMPNYSSNPAYPHPSSGNSYLLMPGGSSHLTAGGMKYATSQYKPVPAGNPSPYGNYTNAAGYAISPPGTVGGASGLDDVSRIKYKDNNLYVPNPQAEASEIWIQTPRDLPNMHSATPFYNLSGQAPHAAYLPTPTGHASFNAAAQSSHVQYPGLYHPPQPATIANPHHLVHQQVPPAVGGNVGVGVAAAAPQVGSYQQPQVGHLNWTANF